MRKIIVSKDSDLKRFRCTVDGQNHEFECVKAEELSFPIPYPTLNPVQSAFYRYYEEGSALVCSSTSSGKSLVSYLFTVKQPGMVVYASPLRALASEKAAEFRELLGPNEVELRSGDDVLGSLKEPERGFLVCTYEYLSLSLRNSSSWLDAIVGVVLDEIHVLFRRTVIDEILSYSLERGFNVLGLSATLPDYESVASHVNASLLIHSEWRPVPLKRRFHHLSDFKKPKGFSGKGAEGEAVKLFDAVEKNARKGEKVIVFVPSKKVGWKMLEVGQHLGYAVVNETVPFTKDGMPKGEPIAFHNADVPKEEREQIEKRFRKGDLNLLVATQTLAYGMNLPTDRVFVLVKEMFLPSEGQKLMIPDVLDILQMEGRAGRFGVRDKGFSELIAYRMKESELKERVLSGFGKVHVPEDKSKELAYTYLLLEAKTGRNFIPESLLLSKVEPTIIAECENFLQERGFVKDGKITRKGRVCFKLGINPESYTVFESRLARKENPFSVVRPLIRRNFSFGYFGFKGINPTPDMVERMYRHLGVKGVDVEYSMRDNTHEFLFYVHGAFFGSGFEALPGDFSYMETEALQLMKTLLYLKKVGVVDWHKEEILRIVHGAAYGFRFEYAPLGGINGLGYMRGNALEEVLMSLGVSELEFFEPVESVLDLLSGAESLFMESFYRRYHDLLIENGDDEYERKATTRAKSETTRTRNILLKNAGGYLVSDKVLTTLGVLLFDWDFLSLPKKRKVEMVKEQVQGEWV